MGDLGQLIVAEGFKKLPKVQKIGQYGHTDWKSKKRTEDNYIYVYYEGED